MVIRRYASIEPPAIDLLVSESRAEGHPFVARALEAWRDGSNRFDGDGEAFFLAEAGSLVVGMCGLNIDPYSADPSVGRIRHLYVTPTWRRRDVGTKLVDACLAAAAGRFRRIRLRTHDPAASSFYVSLGFARVHENHATHAITPASIGL